MSNEDFTIALQGSLIRRIRPLHIGLSVGHPRGSTGTLGAFILLPDRRRAIMSASFVLAPGRARHGDMIHQPGSRDQPTLTGQTRIGLLHDFTPLSVTQRMTEDFAVAVLLDDIAIHGNIIPSGCPGAGRPIFGVADENTFEPGEPVAFVGIGSGYREGRITAIDLTNLAVTGGRSRQIYYYDHLLEVASDSGPFSHAGDGGALVWRQRDGAAIGLILASVAGQGYDSTYIVPIARNLKALGATWLTPGEPDEMLSHRSPATPA